MEEARLRRQSRSFGQAVERYDRARPRYAEEALRWALPTLSGAAVADLGAGTGILTRQLITLGYRCVAIEPDEQMRQRCSERLRAADHASGHGSDHAPSAEVVAGTAEAIPLAENSVDAVIAGQAYHWFRPADAHREVFRVLRPGGVFAPVWNIRDDTEPWVAALSTLAEEREYEDGTGAHAGWRAPPLKEHFHAVERKVFRHAVRHTPASLRDLVRSRSYYLTAATKRQAAVDSELHHLLASHPDLVGRQEFDLPYVTVAYRARRP